MGKTDQTLFRTEKTGKTCVHHNRYARFLKTGKQTVDLITAHEVTIVKVIEIFSTPEGIQSHVVFVEKRCKVLPPPARSFIPGYFRTQADESSFGFSRLFL
jgi:hypothetical protein